MSMVPGQLYLQYFIAFSCYVNLNIHHNKFLKQDTHFRPLFKTADADKTCRFTLFESERNIPLLFYSDEFKFRCIPDTHSFFA